MTPGTRVRILRPDKPAHATGVVAESLHPYWAVWVRHECGDCWRRGNGTHTRGYDESEVVEG